MKGVLLISLALILSNAAALAISVIVPLLIPPHEYSLFALSWSLGQFVAMVGFEWLRVGVIRHAFGADQELAGRRRTSLVRGYWFVAWFLLIVIIAALSAAWLTHWAVFVAAIAGYGIGQGCFDGAQAFTRARFDNRKYALAWVLRGSLGLVFASACAWAVGTGLAVMVGLCAAYLMSLAIVEFRSIGTSMKPSPPSDQLRFLARFGVFLALGTVLASLLNVVIRGLSIPALGPDGAAGFFLALDLSQKAVLVIGLATSLIMTQSTIRIMEHGSEADIDRRISWQIGRALAFIMPASVGFFLVQDSVLDLVVGTEYRDSFSSAILGATVCAGAIAVRQFAVDNLFNVIGRPMGAFLGPLVAVVAAASGILIASWWQEATPNYLASVVACASIVSLLVSMAALNHARAIRWPVADAIKIVLGLASMVIVRTYLIPSAEPVLRLTLTVGLCGSAYGAVLLLTNAADLRTIAVGNCRRIWPSVKDAS